MAQEAPGGSAPNGNSRNGGTSRDTSNIAVIVVASSLVLVAVLSVIAIWNSSKSDSAEKVLTMVLPMIAAWVGTILAFYFSKDNYAAAASSASQLVTQLTSEQRLRSIRADAAMIPIKDATAFVLKQKEAEVRLKADLLDGNLIPNKRNRLPILSPEGRIKYTVHRSLIDRFLVEQLGAANFDVARASLEELLNDPNVGGAVKEAFGTVRPEATLADVKAQLDGIPNCADVFVTEDGTRNTPVVGWLTNTIVAERSRV